MRHGTNRHNAGTANGRAWRIAAILALAPLLIGCIGENLPPGTRVASLGAAPAGATIAFESVDGPPPQVFQRLVENLAEAAVARKVAVISREAAPQYRVRGYLAAHVDRRSTHIGWVWDVYSADKRRILRIAGEEPVTRRVSDAWSVADDHMLRPGDAAPALPGRAVASNDDAPALAAAMALADAHR
jgi:hypothetical protein